MNTLIVATLIVGLFHFSEGKPCPEETRAHATRCDSYFRCVVLPSKTHVWVPTQCERGLIYEPNLRLCVLPGDDWECTLGETSTMKQDENNIYGVNALVINPTTSDLALKLNEKEVSIVESNVSGSSDEGDYIEVSNVVGATKGGNYLTASGQQHNSEESLEFSGDGTIEGDKVETKDGSLEIQDSSKVDPKLAAQLQRLSQIIGGLKEKYQTHYNIRSQFEAISPSTFDKRPIPEDGRIEQDVLQHILKRQQQLQKSGLKANYSMSTPSVSSNGYVRVGIAPKPTASYSQNKIYLHNSVPSQDYRNPERYSNSQIVVNKPEGSVLFSLPPNDKYQPRPTHEEGDLPRISEETLKTVLELSKQMLSNQNIRQVVPNSAIYHSVVQPMYFPLPMLGSQQGNIYSNQYRPQSDYENEDNYNKISTQTQPIREDKRKPSATAVQNNVEPLTISQGSATGMIPRPIMPGHSSLQETPLSYQQQADDRIDSYGNKIPNSYHRPVEPNREQFPPYQGDNEQTNTNSIFSTTLYPPLNYDIPPHVTPASAQTPNPNYDNAYFNSYNTRPQQAPTYPTGLNMAPEMPKPISQPQFQYFQSHSNSRPQTQQPSESYMYNEIAVFPKPPKLRPINPNAVNIRPNSFQTSANGISYNAADFEDELTDDSHFSYNQNNANNLIVSDALASNVDHSRPPNGHSQLVNLGGNFISYDVYKNQILPLFGPSAASGAGNNVEVITCATGVRLPNATDCTRYYVCSKKDGKVLSYSCPPYTGFNAQTHICDAKTYAYCNPQALYNRFTVSENRRIQNDAKEALEEAKKVRNEALQAQNLANLIRLETQKVVNMTIPQRTGIHNPIVLKDYMSNYHLNNPAQGSAANSMMVATMMRPQSQMTRVKSKKKSKRPRIPCSEGAKIPDPESVLHYYVCYKSSEGKLRRRKMECTPGLMFCDQTMYCTLPRKCNA